MKCMQEKLYGPTYCEYLLWGQKIFLSIIDSLVTHNYIGMTDFRIFGNHKIYKMKMNHSAKKKKKDLES